MCACVCVCMRACKHACMCVHASMHACVIVLSSFSILRAVPTLFQSCCFLLDPQASSTPKTGIPLVFSVTSGIMLHFNERIWLDFRGSDTVLTMAWTLWAQTLTVVNTFSLIP